MIVQGGQFVQLFHKELEAYLVAEGLFQEIVSESGASSSSASTSLGLRLKSISFVLFSPLQSTCASASWTR